MLPERQIEAEHLTSMRLLQRLDWPAIALVTFLAVYGSVVLLEPAGARATLVLSDVLGSVPPLAAGLLSLRAAMVGNDRARRGWLLFGLGCLTWGAGEVVWGYYELVLGQESPFPSVADAAYLASVPLFFVGILLLTVPASAAARLRRGLDALAVVMAASAFSWHFVIGPIYASSDATTFEKVLTSAYPLGDLALLFALALSVPRLAQDRGGQILGVLGAGLVLFLLADTGFAYLENTSIYESGSIVDLGWVAATTLFAYAAVLQHRWRADFSERRPSRLDDIGLFHILPILLLPVVVGWLLLMELLDQPLGRDATPTLTFIFLFTVFTVLRQATALLDTVAANRVLALSNATLEVKTEKLSEELLREQVEARRDWLTGTLSRRAIMQELERRLSGGTDRLAVGMIDLDGLKAMNDLRGHAAGDQILKLVGTALALDGATVGRFGGDEFVVILPGAGESEVFAYQSIVDWRLGSLAERERLPAPVISSGFALYPEQGTTAKALLALADERMYRQKNQKKGRGNPGMSPAA